MSPTCLQKKTQWLLGLVIVYYLTGCSSDQYHTPEIISYDPTLETVDMKKKQINPWKYRIPDEDRSLYSQAVGTDDAAKSARNRLQSIILTLSDIVTEEHLAKIFATEDTSNIGLGMATVGLSAIGTAVSAASTKTALSAGASITEGSRSIINEELYSNAFAPAISKAIRAKRRAEHLSLEIKRGDKSMDDYNVDDAIHDALHYHQMGSFYYGLELVQKATHRAVAKIDDEEIAPLEQKINPKADVSYTLQTNKDLRKELNVLLSKPLTNPENNPGTNKPYTTKRYAEVIAGMIKPGTTVLSIKLAGGEELQKLVDALKPLVE